MEQQRLWERAERLRGAADEAARLAQNLYLSFLLFGTYIAIIIGSTTDMQLLKVSPVTLPLLNVQLPIVGFYAVVPWLLLLLYFYLLLHLTFLAQKLHRLNAVLATFTDEAVWEEQRLRLFPFPFSVMLIGRPARWRLRWLLGLMVLTTIVLLPLLLLLWAQIRFLPYHNMMITWNHRIAVGVDLILLGLFWPLMLIPERCGGFVGQEFPLWREEQRQRATRRVVRTRRLRWWIGISSLALITEVFSLCVAVLPEEFLEAWTASYVPARWRITRRRQWQQYIPYANQHVFIVTVWLFDVPGALFHRNLQFQKQVLVAGDPSAKVIAALESQDKTKREQGLEEITGLTLTNRDLRSADLSSALLVKVDLRGANLKGANLDRARVYATNLSGFQIFQGEHCVDTAHLLEADSNKYCRTDLQGSILQGTQLEGNDMQGVLLSGANLMFAQLEGNNMQRAQLLHANLMSAQLKDNNMQRAQLQDVTLTGVIIRGNDMRSALLSAQSPSHGVVFHGNNVQGAQISW
jgi:uncharacterized protein YjbI with pentapeptide repeats